ncbi:hypothetical protein BD777DRAFT_125421 [Yarrowia lipolytica]|nr:hypothetical protein BD777DRAFT_125421 [Yarrowia lipolytica]
MYVTPFYSRPYPPITSDRLPQENQFTSHAPSNHIRAPPLPPTLSVHFLRQSRAAMPGSCV